ncbi:DUF1015 family protein [Nocardioides sp. J2M5]|uniref:DUF1015 family protein n=1 Tax=Nocardioides palaemonis TaxID=2829810 RepID=UPI001BACFDC7|nr:DUF1015 family protein [Nocardioides palaemonis]MBS2937917.1 DUF1015 family protein [Nocardioides palaemonis]
MDVAAIVPPYVAKPFRLVPFTAVMLAPGRVGDPASARALARPYRDVATRLTRWIDEGRASADQAPAIYLHEYTVEGLTVRGLVGALDVARRAADAADRAVWPHEAIHPDQAGELADRMQQMALNPAPILLVHHGSADLRALLDEVARLAPDWSYLDRTGQRQRIWAVRDPDRLARLDDLLARTTCLIADGHHRYAAYLRLQQQHPGTAWDSGLAMLVDQDDTPLFLGAIHRTLAGSSLDELVSAARAAGADVAAASRDAALAVLDSTHLALTDGTAWVTIAPHGLEHRAAVAWLHEEVLPLLPRAVSRVDHHHSVEEALALAGPSCPAILLPSPDFEQVKDLVEAGGLLPEKATSFQPKPSLGVLMRPLRDA